MWAGTLHARGRKARLFWTSAICAAATAVLAGEARAQEGRMGPSIFFTPSIGVQETYTDNANLTSEQRSSDFVTRGQVGVDVAVDRGPLTGRVEAEYAYDWYASNSDLNGGSLMVNGTGEYVILKDRLWIEGQGNVTNGYTTTFGSSAVDRSGVQGRTQLGVYNVGPHVATTLGSYADLEGALRYEQVLYSEAESSEVPELPSDDNIFQGVVRIDTGERFAKYQLLTTAQYEADDQEFHTENAVQSVFISIHPAVRILARAGYERVYQEGVTDISSPVLSAGLEFRINPRSRITIEGGERYKRSAWSARANIQISDRLFVSARYIETLAPDQLYVAQSFEEFVEETARLPAPIVPGAFTFRENLYNQTSYNKSAEIHALYAGPIQSLDFSARWSDRRFLISDTHDRSIIGYLSYSRRIRPDLDFVLTGDYARTLDSPLYGESETYGFSGRLFYRLNSKTTLNVGYNYTHGQQLFEGGEEVRENAVLIALQRRF
jgi:uncharacterized protein (PEP-CTERM system associated)